MVTVVETFIALNANDMDLHLAVSDLAAALKQLERAGGVVIRGAREVAPGVALAMAEDTEGNLFALVQREEPANA